MVSVDAVSILRIALALSVVFCSESSTSAAVYCPPMWEGWGTSCYRLTARDASWQEGLAACRDMGVEMAAPYSAEENEFMAMKALNAGLDWLWVACKHDGGWKCEGQEKNQTYFNWAPREPTKKDGDESAFGYCAYMGISSRRWNDEPCTRTPRAICVQRSAVKIRQEGFSKSHDQQFLNWCLVGHVIREFVTKSAPRCAAACMAEPACRSFNVQTTKQEQKLCQLNGASRSDDPDKFQKTNAFCAYYSD